MCVFSSPRPLHMRPVLRHTARVRPATAAGHQTCGTVRIMRPHGSTHVRRTDFPAMLTNLPSARSCSSSSLIKSHARTRARKEYFAICILCLACRSRACCRACTPNAAMRQKYAARIDGGHQLQQRQHVIFDDMRRILSFAHCCGPLKYLHTRPAGGTSGRWSAAAAAAAAPTAPSTQPLIHF